MPAHGRVDRRVATTEPALLLTLWGERLPLLRERLPLLGEGLSLLRVGLALLEGLLLVRRLRGLTVLLLSGVTRLAWLAAVPLALLRLARLLRRLLVRLGVLGELLRGRPVTARLTWVGVLRRLGRGCGHGRFL
ncbi:hypothetical protein AB0L70_05245 [Kribbella sp. NPDC051952]|uniref:hypothetical protein n=1 Tax=Kribbella sp. NPDC051952 TaxID=3154851 RepID=UPI0034249BF6